MPGSTRREFLRAASAGAAAAVLGRTFAQETTAPARRPNILFLFADQMRGQSMGCAGSQALTPRLDRFAAEGVRVTNAISCNPVCTPFRAQLLTGRHGHSTGVLKNDDRLPNEEMTIGEFLRERGYATGYIGKWHLAGHRNDPVPAGDRRGWDYWAVRNCSHDYFHPCFWLNSEREPVQAEGWEPEVQAALAADFIKTRQDRPFCLFVSFGPPHDPYKAPARYRKLYPSAELAPRPNVPNPSPAMLAEYYAMITGLDSCVGRILDALEEAGVAEDTICCFSSDHGDMLGSQGYKGKQVPWEESINIPFILRYPRRVSGNRIHDWIISPVDVMPTLFGLCGEPVPETAEGMNHSNLFLGREAPEREAAFLFHSRTGRIPGTDWRGIRTKGWVYAYHAFGDWILYDLQNDPYQLRNRIKDPACAEKREELRSRLDRMREELGERIPVKGRWTPDPVKLPSAR